MLKSRKEKLMHSLKLLFNKNTVNMTSSKPTIYPCYFENCNFQGPKLRKHLESNGHNLPSDTAQVQQSYLTPNVNYLTKVSKTKQKPPTLCVKCRLFFDRIDLHLRNHYQLRRKTKELQININKSITVTNIFLEEFKKNIKRYDEMNVEKKGSSHQRIEESPIKVPQRRITNLSYHKKCERRKETHTKAVEQYSKEAEASS